MSDRTPEYPGFANTDGPDSDGNGEDGNNSGSRAGAGCLAGIAIAIIPFIALSFNGSSPNGFGIAAAIPIFVILGGIIGIASLFAGRND